MAVVSNIYADAGTDFSASITVTDSSGTVANLTGYTAAAMARRTYTSTTSYPFSASVSNASGGVVTLTMTDTLTDTMSGRYVYDCEITAPNGTKTRVIEGMMEVSPGVTR